MADNTINIKVKVDDQGNLSLIGKKSKEAASGLDRVAASARTADRNLKGTARTSSNTTKNFSKMAQGTGGLVGAYASLAAQIFAISAAFNFLKSAGDLRVLQASQQNYAASTGLAMKVLANDIVDATNAQISFQDASQAAAIGTSAGLNPAQLKELGTAAKNLSITLGRDVTDSFNRLVRGVTKAEPELLDELGIILRLEDAQREYGLRIGKNAKDLTQFEKSQAVVNKVLEEANRVAAVTPEGVVNQYNQLAKAFDDILIQIKLVADSIAGPLAKVLTDTPALAIASFLLLLKGPLAAIGINFKEMAIGAKESAAAQSLAAQKAKAAYESTKITIQSTTAAVREQAAAFAAAGSSSKLLQQFGSGGAMTPQARATIKRALAAAEKDYNEHTKITKGIFKGMDIAIVRDFALAMKQMDAAEAGKVASTRKNVALIVSAYTTGMALVKRASAWLLTWGTRVLGALGWIGIAVTGFQILADQFGLFKKEVDESAERLERTRERTAELNKEYEKFIENNRKLLAVGRGQEIFGNVATMLSMTSDSEFLSQLQDFRAFEQARQEVEAMEASLEGLRGNARVRREAELGIGSFFRTNQLEEARAQLKDLEEGGEAIQRVLNSIAQTDLLGDDQQKAFVNLRRVLLDIKSSEEDIIQALLNVKEVGTTFNELQNLERDSRDALGTFTQSLVPVSRGQQAIDALRKEADAINKIAAGRVESGVTPGSEEDTRLKEIARLTKIIADEEKRQNDFKIKNIELNIQQENSLRNLQKEFRQQVTLETQRERLLEQAKNNFAEQTFLRRNLNSENLEENEQNARRLAQLQAEHRLLRAQRYTVDDLLAVERARVENNVNIRRLNVAGELARQQQETVNLVAKEVTFQKQLLDFESKRRQLRLDASEGALRAQTAFSFVDEEERVAIKRFELEKEMILDRINQINKEFESKIAQAKIENEIARNRLKVSELELRNRAAAKDISEEERSALISLANSTAAQADSLNDILTSNVEVLTSEQGFLIEQAVQNLNNLEAAKVNLSDLNVLASELAQTLHSDVKNALTNLFTGEEGSLKDAVIGIAQSIVGTVAEQAAKNLSDLIFQGGGAAAAGATMATAIVTAGQTAALAMGSAISIAASGIFGSSSSSSGNFFQNLIGIFGSGTGGPSAPTPAATPVIPNTILAAHGAIMKGGFRAYNNGGIVSQPTVGLVGEGRFNEAVVPLPNGKAIPVDMKGTGGVTVNVAVNNNGSATTSVEGAQQQSANFGKAIAMAVQKEIQNQKRSGGMLSPYGAA